MRELHRITDLGAVIMFAQDSVPLRLKRLVLGVLGLRHKPDMWFPLKHAHIVEYASRNGWDIVMFRDMVRWISESRLYVLRRRVEAPE